MTTLDKIIFYGGGAWGQALAIALSNCNTKSSILENIANIRTFKN